MACHQAHNIPWNILSSNFKYSYCQRGHEGRTNLYPLFKERQGKELHYFIEAFRKNLASHADVELRKYEDTAAVLEPEDILITDDVMKRIRSTVHHCDKAVYYFEEFSEKPGVIPPRYRKAGAFLHPSEELGWQGKAVAYSLELFKLLILYGEMGPLQHICQHPHANWVDAWEKHRDAYGDQNECGWGHVATMALEAYLTLNLLLCFPQLWDEDSGRDGKSDYRNTKCYQRMLRECTMRKLASNIAALPHRQFFGITEGQFDQYGSSKHGGKYSYMLEANGRREYPYGVMPIHDFLELESRPAYQPNIPDVLHVRWCLCELGLPTEIAIEIMDAAGYVPTRRLEEPHDPLHPSNREELRKYLDYCWNILVRCEVMSRWLGDKIPWDIIVSRTLIELVGEKHHTHGTHGRKLYEQDFELDERQGFRQHEMWVYRFC
ncbi:uncharacterized protein CTRU02_202269 [Colletotrichum truncatum]|uniref:Uncharacterized protein n=1 Tax=Colletotrichum truncatum TaxID=5467 RepID=A0ACC3ZJS5_COLTU|nr:uncharacterized protein CTRU02_01429 [Colletotrichum truncatum]KAF6799750.1 hypothetical protein CTRU02_01429 [Colletotrichum truncatum]